MASELTAPPLADVLARFVAGCDAGAIPPAVVHEAKRALVGYFGTAVAGSRDPTYAKLHAVLAPPGGTGAATLIGHAGRVDILTAAFLNAVAANQHDFDDTHIPTIIHPTAQVAAALFALGESRPLDGRTFLCAFVLGVEVECRLGRALSPLHYQRGWHITATCGVVGAAAACAKALGLAEGGIAAAMGCAATQAAGLVECLGSSAKSLGIGNAARNGLLSALLAERGFDAPSTALDGKFGFLRVLSDHPEPQAATERLGEVWELANNTHKPYPCGVVVNPVIDCCLKARAERSFALSDIERVVFFGHPLLGVRADRPVIRSGRQAQVSLQHAAAVALLEGPPRLAHFTDACVLRPDMQELRARIGFEAAELGIEAARMRLVTRGGDEVLAEIDCSFGSLGNPMSDADLEEKMLTLTGGPAEDVRRLADSLWRLDDLASASAVLGLSSFGQAEGRAAASPVPR